MLEQEFLIKRYQPLLNQGADVAYLAESVLIDPTNISDAVLDLLHEGAFNYPSSVMIESMLSYGNQEGLNLIEFDRVLVHQYVPLE